MMVAAGLALKARHAGCGGARLQQDHRTAINPGVLWGDCGEEQSRVSAGCATSALMTEPSPGAISHRTSSPWWGSAILTP